MGLIKRLVVVSAFIFLIIALSSKFLPRTEKLMALPNVITWFPTRQTYNQDRNQHPLNLKLPFEGGAEWKVLQGYNQGTHCKTCGSRVSADPNNGYMRFSLDLDVADEERYGLTTDKNVVAMADGWHKLWGEEGWNNSQVLRHPDSYYTMYTHLDGHVSFDSNQFIPQDTIIGETGDVGSGIPHIHITLFQDTVDPNLNKRVPVPFGIIESVYDFRWDGTDQPQFTGIEGLWSDTQAPKAPSDVRATALDSNRIRVEWDYDSNNIDGFKVFRYGSQIAIIAADTTSYEDTGLSCDTTYLYYVKTYNNSGDSEKSNTAITMTDSCPTDTPSGELLDQQETRVVRAIDPNDKLGPEGVGSARVVSKDDELAYTVRFENMSSATAPVQELVVVDYLDFNIDWTTFQFSEVAYGDRLIPLPPDILEFSTRDFPTSPTITGTVEGQMAIDIAVTFNPQTGRAKWHLKAIDTATELPPEDPLAGFLPPEDGTGRGQGQVTFAVKPKPDVVAGTRITNTASIVFDINDPIETDPVAWNTIGELGQLHFDTITNTVGEDEGNATIPVVRTDGSTGEVTVNYATGDGTATASSDYTAVSGILTFADGETTAQTITIPIINDDLGEEDETVILSLNSPGGGATLGNPSTAVITIVDNDASATCDLAGDDGIITAEDIQELIKYWREIIGPPHDHDGDGEVTVADIMWYVTNWGEPCP